jgi:hypothetical protein
MADVKIGNLSFGLDKRKKGERLISKRVLDCSGFLYYKKLVRKEFQLISSSLVCDNLRKRDILELTKCSMSCPEIGSSTEGGSGAGTW